MACWLVQALRHLRSPLVSWRKRIKWLTIATLGPIFIGIACLLWSASTQIIAPETLTLGDYQLAALEEPALEIVSTSALDGEVPFLAVSPHSSNLSKRGQVLREQLTERQVDLLPYGEIRGTLVLLHGRRGRKESLLRVAERFTAIGFRCLIPDLPAHGESPRKQLHYGSSPFERDLALEVVQASRASLGWPEPNEALGLWGMSMGGAFATAAAAQSEDTWDALMIVCSFDQLDGVLSDKLGPLARPVEALVKHRSGFQMADAAPAIWASKCSRIPVFIAHGDQDPLISQTRGEQLLHAFPHTNKTWLTVTGANHHNVLITEQPVYASMGQWLLENCQ